jgi:hypothetical protein
MISFGPTVGVIPVAMNFPSCFNPKVLLPAFCEAETVNVW